MSRSYWAALTSARLSRRQALVSSGAGALGAAFLAACGGGSDDKKDAAPSGPKDTSGLLFSPVDTSKSAVKGGTYLSAYNQEPLNYDPLSSSSQFTFGHAHTAYQRFFSLKRGTFNDPATGDPEGDAVSSWEYSPDGLTLTLKLRPGTKFDPRPPTSSRLMTTEDVKWSYDRFIALQPGRNFFSNQLSPDAPITSMTYPDASTIVIKLAFPMGALLKMFGTIYYFAILPTDAESKFDIRQDMRGSGAWMMTKYERSVGWEYQRNPNWYRANERPYFDGLNYALVADYVANSSAGVVAQAQFKAKRLWNITPAADLVLGMRREDSTIQMVPQSPFRGQASINYIGMSKLPTSKWEKDVRLRQALSMTIDRDLYIDTFSNVSGFEKEGLPMEVGHNTHVPASWPTIWLDPKKNQLGDNSKYLQYQPDEAAKLLRAAGAFGAEDSITYAATGLFGTQKQLEVLAQMWNEKGHFKIKLNPEDYTTVITPKYTFGKGQYPDLGTHPLGSWSDWDTAMFNTFTPSGRNDYVGHDTPELKDLMTKYRRELDVKKRNEIAKDWQKAMAKEMVIIPFPGAATRFDLQWPWYGNGGYFQTAGGGVVQQEVLIDQYYDKAKDKG